MTQVHATARRAVCTGAAVVWLLVASVGPAIAAPTGFSPGAEAGPDASDAPTNPCGGGSPTAAAPASIVPDDCWGPFPSSHYDVGYDEGAWNHVGRKVYGAFTDLSFQGGRAATATALWLVEWAFGFGVYDRLGGAAVDVAGTYQSDLVGPLGLTELVWFYAVAWAAFAALRGRTTMALGELATSVVVAGLAGVLLANPAGYLAGTFDTLGRLSSAVLAAGTGEVPPDDGSAAQAVLAPLQAEIHQAFVEEPYEFLNWGGPVPAGCRDALDAILAHGPHGADDDPRAAMTAAGCDDQTAFQEEPTGTRLFGAVLTAVAAVAMAVLVGLVSVTVVVAEVMAVLLFAIAPLALLGGVLPGAGRELAWRWLTALARVVLAVIGMSLVLSLLLLTVGALLGSADDLGLVERFALVNMVVVTMFVARRRILAGGHAVAANFGQRIAARRVGGERAAPWMATPAFAGATGFALASALGPDRPTRTGRLAGTYGRSVVYNRGRRRMAAKAEARAAQPVARERTDIGADGDGHPFVRRTTTVDGPQPQSRRARAVRHRVERAAAREHAAEKRRDERPDRWGERRVDGAGEVGTSDAG